MSPNWKLIRDPQDPELDRLAELHQLHPLHIEDCRHRKQSAKVEEIRDYIFTVLKPVRIDEEDCLRVVDLDLFLGKDYIITVEEPGCPELRHALEQIEASAGNLRPDQVFYRVTDAIVDSYLPVLDHLGEVIDELQDEVLEHPAPESLARIFETKRNLALLRRVLVNTRDVAGHLQRTESKLIHRDLWPFLRDVYDHVARNLDTIDMLRDLLTGALDVYLSSVANQTNQVMKVLTVVGTIALPALVISGIYGMNVEGLPWVHAPHGALIIIAVAVAASVALLFVLRKFGWF